METKWLYEMLPCCKATPERRQKLRGYFEKLEEGNLEEASCEAGVVLSADDIVNLISTADDYWDLVGSSSVSRNRPDAKQVSYLITGGPSFDGDPNEAYTVMHTLNLFGEVWDMLEAGARGDLK